MIEATGGYETTLVALPHGAGLPVVPVNPRQTRDFARVRGRLEALLAWLQAELPTATSS